MEPSRKCRIVILLLICQASDNLLRQEVPTEKNPAAIHALGQFLAVKILV
jgi:hypothetical protein